MKKFDRLPQAFILKNFLKAVLHEKKYGIVEKDIHLPDDLNEYSKEVSPISKNTIIERQHLSAEMQEYAKEYGLMKTVGNDWSQVILGKKTMITTDYNKWCLDDGLIVTKCYQFFCYKKAQAFRDFYLFCQRK